VHQLFSCSLEEKLFKIQLQLQQPVPCLNYKGSSEMTSSKLELLV